MIETRVGPESLRVEAWGPDAVRVRIAQGPVDLRNDHGLLPKPLPPEPPGPEPRVETDGGRTLLVNGALTVEVSAPDRNPLQQPDLAALRFLRTSDGSELLAERGHHMTWPPARHWTAAGPGGGLWRVAARFAAYDDERLYGLGQHSHGRLDHTGVVTDLTQRNGEVSIPFVLSSRGYGFLWNNPGVGRMEAGATATRWVADGTDQLDYWVCAADSPAGVVSRFTAVTGRAPRLPGWASGFWQSKLRYPSQAELMAVADEFLRRDLPLSVLVVDYGHWRHLGDFRFDPDAWPDSAGMVAELASRGVRVAVSLWPMATARAETFDAMLERGFLVRTRGGSVAHTPFVDVDSPVRPGGGADRTYLHVYDATDPQARAFLWERLAEGYLRHGIDVFWLDADEPEVLPGEPDALLYFAGPGVAVANRYPLDHARMVYDGLTAASGSGCDVLTLNRSAWVGSARYGAAVWSGDVAPTWRSLAAAIPAGLSIGVSGIPWWTTDIGGFGGGDPADPAYRELVVRWMQFAVFCPLMRMHGFREPIPRNPMEPGGDNEPWSYGEEAYAIIREQILLRERLRPYVHSVADEASATGLPMMRPLFLACPSDGTAWTVDDQFLLGDEVLVAPVLGPGVASREAYLPVRPDRRAWVDVATDTVHAGGSWVTADAPPQRIPVFTAEGATVLTAFRGT